MSNSKKKPTKKRKINARGRRLVRRVIAALLMITALGIAAIPSDRSGIARASSEPIDYDADSLLQRNGDLTSPTVANTDFLKASTVSNNDLFFSYEVREIDGNWSLLWKYQYYVPKDGVGGVTNVGVLSGYNDTYEVQELNLSGDIYTCYDYVASSEFDDYLLTTLNPTTFKLDLNPNENGTDGTKLNDVKKYFPSEYDDWSNLYATKLSEYQAGHEGQNPAKLADMGMSPLILSGSEMVAEKKAIYYCDHTNRPGYTLEKVKNLARNSLYRASNGLTKNLPDEDMIYICHVADSTAIKEKVDENGFQYKEGMSIIAIAENAFANTQKVHSMNVGQSVAYIGDSAFENSFIEKVDFASVTYIGNRVFKGCQYLNEVFLATKTEIVGKEAFRGCKELQTINIPEGVKEIGYGGFSGCSILTDVNFSKNHGINIGEYAFFDCPLLTNVVFPENYDVAIGKAAFALIPGTGTTATLVNFNFPKSIKEYVSASNGDKYTLDRKDGSSYNSRLGDYILANRNNLDTVLMPVNFGSSDEEIVPDNTFDMCIDLGCLKFDTNSNGYATFDNDLFEDVENDELYVFGPPTCNKTGADGKYYAYPRRSTWECYRGVNHEFADYVPYVYYLDNKDHYEVGIGDYRYELEVDDSNNTATLLRCEFIKNEQDIDLIVPNKVAKYDIKNMLSGCFDNIKPYILSVTVEDDSIETLGDKVFNSCPKLKTVKLGNSVATLGSECFSDNPVLSAVYLGENTEKIGEKCFNNCPSLTDAYYASPNDYSILHTIGTNAFSTQSPKLLFHCDLVDGYLPFDYAMNDNKINTDSVRIAVKSLEPTCLTCIKDENTGLVTLIDYMHYHDLPSDIRNKYEAKMALNDSEQQLLNATQYITLPESVESVDIASFLSSETNNPNRKNFVYIDNTPNDLNTVHDRQSIYGDEYLKDPTLGLLTEYYSDLGGYTPGLFSGYMSEFNELMATDINSSGFATKGNDWIASIDMPGVKYIPDYCFDSCERLQSVIISESCNDIGEGAFQGCESLLSIGTNNNPRYLFDNFILYEGKDDGSYNIVTCLPSRGKSRGAKEIWVNPANDPLLPEVSSMTEGAFASCKYIAKAELSDCTKLKTIPAKAFNGCTSLSSVELPNTITAIAKEAFNNGAGSLDITVPCDCNISDEAFDKDTITTVWTYQNCPITAAYDPVGYDQVYIKFLNQAYTLTFLNDDLTVYDKLEVYQGFNGFLPKDDPVPLLPEHKDYEFAEWYFDNPNTIYNVTENRQSIAVFKAKSQSNNSASDNDPDDDSKKKKKSNDSSSSNKSGSSTDNKSSSSNSASTNAAGYNVSVENGAGSGRYEVGKVVTITAYAPAQGKSFDKWTTSNTDIGFSNATAISTTFIMPAHDVKVTATYKTGGISSNSVNSVNGLPTGNSNKSQSSSSNAALPNKKNKGTEVRVTTDEIDNNKKNLASASVAGSSDNFVVKITDSAAASAAVEEALNKKYNNDLSGIKFVAFDISLYDETGTYPIENYEDLAVTITLPIPDDLVSYAGNNKAAAVINGEIDDKAVKFTTIDGVPCMTFTATHFSPYTVYVDTNNLLMGANDLTPKTGIDIAPKWFLAIGMALVSAVLFLWKEKPKKKLAA